jgi:hypothetical protein
MNTHLRTGAESTVAHLSNLAGHAKDRLDELPKARARSRRRPLMVALVAVIGGIVLAKGERRRRITRVAEEAARLDALSHGDPFTNGAATARNDLHAETFPPLRVDDSSDVAVDTDNS